MDETKTNEAKQSKSSAKKKGTNGYVANINAALREHLGLNKYEQIPIQYKLLVSKTAQDMCMLDRVVEEINGTESLTKMDQGSKGQMKTVVSPLMPYYDKLSARVTDDLYNLGLTSRKQAERSIDPLDKRSQDRMKEFIESTQG